MKAEVQEADGPFRRLRGSAEIETSDMLLTADEIDYNEDTDLAEARGHVHYRNYTSNEELFADRVDYNLKDNTGNFYTVRGSAPGKFDPRPGVPTTGNPFVFRGDWAERVKDNRYFLYKGTLTNCTYPNPWWYLQASKFDIIPNDRALGYKSIFRMKGVPLLYAPVFYKAMSESPRRSGFLTPNFGTSSRRGYMFGIGYYWAINRSFDVLYRPQYFTQRGLSHMVDFRGKPTQRSDFNVFVYGIDDKGLLMDDGTRQKQGGYLISATGRAEMPKGFYARVNFNYLSSFLFRQSFTESFNEAVFSQVNSIAYIGKDWSTFHLYGVFQELENFQSTNEGDKISIRRLPQVEFASRPRKVNEKVLPVWVEWTSNAAMMRRTQPLYQTRQFVSRIDVMPRVMTSLHFWEFHLTPWAGVRNTFYGQSIQNNAVSDQRINRFSQEYGMELAMPSLVRVFDAPSWLGKQVKHAIEPRAVFHAVRGIDNFNQIIRFEESEVYSNTTELEVSLTNRFWVKRKDGAVWDALTWELAQRRYFDPNFGGAIISGQRTVLQTGLELTGYSFFDRPRNYSPVVSTLRLSPRPGFGLEARTDYDPLRGKIINNSLSADVRLSNYFFSGGHNMVTCMPLYGAEQRGIDTQTLCATTPQPPGTVLSPVSNQFRGMIGLGQENRRGWNAGFLAIYDYTVRTLQYANAQVTYNTDCCAYAFQYRRFAFGTRNENQFRFSFAIANIGSFGTLRRQDRLF